MSSTLRRARYLALFGIIAVHACGPSYGYVPQPTTSVRMRWDGRLRKGCGDVVGSDAFSAVPLAQDNAVTARTEGWLGFVLDLASSVVFIVGTLMYDGDHEFGANLMASGGAGIALSGFLFADMIRRRDDAMNRYNDTVGLAQPVDCREGSR